MKINCDTLKIRRKSKGYTARDFSNLCGIKEQSYYAYESGRANPKTETAKIIASKLGVSIEYLQEKHLCENEKTEYKAYIRNDFLKDRRKSFGFSAAYMAKEIGVTNAVYLGYEKKSKVPMDKVQKICVVLNMKTDRLVIRTVE